MADKDGIVSVPTPTVTYDTCTTREEDPDKSWCYCGEPTYGKMIMCEHKCCTIQLFHSDCLRIWCPPKLNGTAPYAENYQSQPINLIRENIQIKINLEVTPKDTGSLMQNIQ